MSYSTPVTDTVTYKDLELRLQNLSAGLKTKLSWLSYAGGLSDRIVELVNNKPYIYPALWQGTNAKEAISMMPSDLYQAFCFWVYNGESELPEYNFSRAWVDVSCIFYCDLRNITSANYKLTKTNIRQDILEAFRQLQYGGYGVIQQDMMIEDDITAVYEGYSLDQVDNKFKMLPKYAIRFSFKFGYLRTCGAFNTYA